LPAYEADDHPCRVVYGIPRTIIELEEYLNQKNSAGHISSDANAAGLHLPAMLSCSVIADHVDQHTEFMYAVMDFEADEGLPPAAGATGYGKNARRSAVTNLSASGKKDKELTAVAVENSINDPLAALKRQKWSINYHPLGMKYGDMIGGVRQVERDRNEAYGDSSSDGRDSKSHLPRSVVVDKPLNQQFQQCMDKARRCNPEASPYAWAAAVRMLSGGAIAERPFTLPINVSLYTNEFYNYAEVTKPLTRMVNAKSLFELSREFEMHGNNPELNFDPKKAKHAAPFIAAAQIRRAETGTFGKTIKKVKGGKSKGNKRKFSSSESAISPAHGEKLMDGRVAITRQFSNVSEASQNSQPRKKGPKRAAPAGKSGLEPLREELAAVKISA
jgi:hypothetical protein